MKIAMLFPDPSSEKGISKYTLDLIKNIEKQGQKIDKIPFLRGKPFSVFKSIKMLRKYDIVHIQHEYNMLGWFGLPYFLLFPLIRLSKKNSLIATMHTVLSQKEEFKGNKLKTFLRKKLYLYQNRRIRKSANKIVVHSNYFKKILVKEYGFPENKIIMFPHAILEDVKISGKEKSRKELGLSGNVYLLIGTMIPDHGHDIILRQADKIGKTILVATNPEKYGKKEEGKTKKFLELNQNIVKTNNFGEFVRFDLGEISYDKWWKYFSASDLILLPYRGGIGSGIFADAMVAKKPVIATDVPYFEEIAKEYGCIKVAREKDLPGIIKEAMNPSEYKLMLRECKRYVKDNNLTAISRKYKEFYNSPRN